MYKKISFRSVLKLGPGNRAGFFIARTRLKSRYAANAAPMSSGGTRSESDVRLRVERMIAQRKAHPDDRFFYVSWRR
jgi:hypothetical protein